MTSSIRKAIIIIAATFVLCCVIGVAVGTLVDLKETSDIPIIGAITSGSGIGFGSMLALICVLVEMLAIPPVRDPLNEAFTGASTVKGAAKKGNRNI